MVIHIPVYKDEKRNTWYFRIYMENEYGEKKQICRSGFKTKNEAKQEEHKFFNTPIKKDSYMTFQELYDVFIKSKKQTLKYQTVRAMISKYKNHILPYFKDYPINKIDNKVYLEWKEQIINKGFSYKYNSSLHGCMVSILNYAMDFYNLERNIAIKVGNFSKGNYFKKVNFWTYEEFLKFIQVVDDNVFSAFYQTLYYTGMRLGECLALTWNDLQDDYICISKTLAKGRINGDYIITTPKTNKSNRKIKINDSLLNILIELKNYYKDFVGYNESWFIFGGLYALGQTTIRRKKNDAKQGIHTVSKYLTNFKRKK